MAVSSDVGGDEGRAELDVLFRCLADCDRRRLLRVVVDRTPGSATIRDLAAVLVKSSDEAPPTRETDPVRRAMVGLYHVQLPALEASGLVELDPDRDTVTAADHRAYRDGGIIDVVRGETGADSESIDALFGALADSRRRTILDVLGHQFGPIHTETLARELGARERDTPGSAVPGETVEGILSSLRHRHLPRLAASGLIEYDAEAGLVEYVGHPALRVPWLRSMLEPDFRANLTGDSEPGAVGAIEGRERVVSFAQSMCDRADEELFCLFANAGMLEAGCFARIRNASRRGVDVYLGTCDPDVREFVREQAPAVDLWEPDADWLSRPVEGWSVGRLLLADREAVVVGTRGVEADAPGEKAVVGEGSDNALVVMIGQMVAPHLDGLDERADVVESHLPF